VKEGNTMKKILITLALSVSTIGCGDDSGGGGAECGAGTTLVGTECVSDVTCGAGTMAMDGMCIPVPTPGPTFVQIEHLARPGINEALLFTSGFNQGYNATAPTFTGVPAATLDQVVAEAKTVLKALYLGGCLLNGVIPDGNGGTLGAANGVKPAGAVCAEVGGAIFTENNPLTGVTLTATTKTAAAGYADRVFAQFVPDVMRIGVGTAGNRPISTYLTLCGDPTQPKPLLCGGRHLRDDTIDITYDYFLNGAATCSAGIGAIPGNLCGSKNQVNALVSDGVVFDTKTISVTAATDVGTGTTATYTATGHGFAVGDVITVNGNAVAGYDGTITVTAVPTSNTFQAVRAGGLGLSTNSTPATATTNTSSRSNGVAANSEQGHINVTKAFPYSAPPH
jgi:hypothetical protein